MADENDQDNMFGDDSMQGTQNNMDFNNYNNSFDQQQQ